MTRSSRVYIAATAKVLAPAYDSYRVVDILYPKCQVSKPVYKMATLLEKQIGFSNRFMVIDLQALPKKDLISKKHKPQYWASILLNQISTTTDLSSIGYVGVAYNVSSHQDILPNLACQIAMDANLEIDGIPSELANYGCAAGIFAIAEAINYCRINQRAAFVYVFDQCSWIANPIYDIGDPNFKASLRSSLLFNDGGIGILLIPEEMRHQYNKPLVEIIDTNKGFQLGDSIKMENASFLVNKGVAEIIPAITAKLSIKPLLKKHALNLEDIAEWSIHQGGLPVLEAFQKQEVLGLSDHQIQRSKTIFQKYGNFSSPSCLYVLDSFVNDAAARRGSYGMVTGFGAGYYYGSLLYQWD